VEKLVLSASELAAAYHADAGGGVGPAAAVVGRGLLSFLLQLNSSTFGVVSGKLSGKQQLKLS